jgi:hypothetical protein
VKSPILIEENKFAISVDSKHYCTMLKHSWLQTGKDKYKWCEMSWFQQDEVIANTAEHFHALNLIIYNFLLILLHS